MRAPDARVARRTAVVLAVIVAGLLLWGVLVEPRLIDVEREVAAVPGLPPAWEGREIALVADIQVGMWLANTGTARRIVRRLVETPPAAVLIAGDFLYQPDDDAAAQIAEAVAIVRPLPKAGIPTYAVLGNHDYSVDEPNDAAKPVIAARLARALEGVGVRVLRNDAAAIPARTAAGIGRGDDPRAGLHVVGLGPRWPGEDDPRAALARVPPGAATLVLMHNPETFQRMAPGTAPVALAGHTHGGQIRLPFTPDWSWLTLVLGERVHAAGWTEPGFGAPGNRLYVNRGIGFSDAPIRINCPPELTRITLRRAAR